MQSKQKAKDNAIQLQIDKIEVGMNEEQLKNILDLEFQNMIKEASIIAHDEAQKRLNDYSKEIIPKIVKYEIYQAFSDPSIQMFLRDTEKSAICSQRKMDYEMLSELLVYRVQSDEDYLTKAAISKAVDIINNISEDALFGLSILFLINSIMPESSRVEEGMKIINDVYHKLLNNNSLPTNHKWLDNLEIVQAINYVPFTKQAKGREIIKKKYNGYFTDGVVKNSEKYIKVIELLSEDGLPSNILIDNPIIENYCILPICSKGQIDDLKLMINIESEIKEIELSQKQKETLLNIFDMYDNASENMIVIDNYIESLLNKYQDLNNICKWWDNNISPNNSIKLTQVGNILGQLNARRIDERIPNIK